MSTPYHIEINKDKGYVRIARHSREVLYWEHTEWEENPELVFTITNAINLALTDPNKMDKVLAVAISRNVGK